MTGLVPTPATMLQLVGVMTFAAVVALLMNWDCDPALMSWDKLIIAEKLSFTAMCFWVMGFALHLAG